MVLAELIAAVESAVRGSLNAVRAFARTLLFRAPPAPPRGVDPEEGALPDSYGETRLVLLVVDPHLVHTYWEVAPAKLREAQTRAGDSAEAVLRFYEAAGSFDVNVDLGPRNWYVPLWSAGRSYYTDLGLKDAEGNFFQLARSNVVVTPRTLPVVEAADPPCAVPAPTPLSSAGGAPLAEDLPRPKDSAEILSGKLAELYAFRESCPEPLKPPEAVREPGGPHPDESGSDLVEMAEQRQIQGLSSPLPRERHPER